MDCLHLRRRSDQYVCLRMMIHRYSYPCLCFHVLTSAPAQAPTMSDRILSMVMPRLAQAGELLLSPLGLLPLRPEASIVYPRQMAGQGDPNREQGRATSLEKVREKSSANSSRVDSIRAVYISYLYLPFRRYPSAGR